MNNARFSRDLDFARFRFYERSGIYDVIMKHKGHALQGASSIRYRRPIPIFTMYKITTKVRLYGEIKQLKLASSNKFDKSKLKACFKLAMRNHTLAASLIQTF